MSVQEKLLFVLFLVNLVDRQGAALNQPYLIYSNRTALGSIELATEAAELITSNLDSVVALDFYNNYIYYGEHFNEEMWRSDLDGSNMQMLMENVGDVEGIAIDWVAGNIYWTSYLYEKIEVARLSGEYRRILINTEIENPRGLAVDPEEGYLFWSDWGYFAAIERCTLSGEDRTQLVTENITWPNGVTLDLVNKRVFWIDAFHDIIYSMNYDGSQRTKIFEEPTLDVSNQHGFDLDYLNGQIYWTDWEWNRIIGLQLSAGQLATVIRNISIPSTRQDKGVMGVVIVDDSRQPNITNRCQSSNCDQLCLLKPNGYKCVCGIGFVLLEDGVTCEDAFKHEFIMYAEADFGEINQVQTDSVNVEPVAIKFAPNTPLRRPVALEYVPMEDRVYWTDVSEKLIARGFRNGSSSEVLFNTSIGVADGLTVDLAGGNLYWTSTTFNVLEMSKFDGSYRRYLILDNLHEPRDIIVDSISGYMYWTDWGIPKIEQANMDGSDRKELVNTSIHWPNGLTLDHIYNKLYWADAYEDTIEVLDLTTDRRSVVVNEKVFLFGAFLYTTNYCTRHPFGLTMLHGYLYWTDWYTGSTCRALVNSGANASILTTTHGRPMDIHAYSIIPKNEQKITYTFMFPIRLGEYRGANFTCYSNQSCPSTMDDPPPCPQGYTSTRIGQKCGLNCRMIQGYTYRCRCEEWMGCAARQTYIIGCASGYYATFKVRECVKAVRPGRCPYQVKGSQNSCVNDEACPGTEKCCNGVCSTADFIETHPCRTNNGGCDQLCIPMPGGYKCSCGHGMRYHNTTNSCVTDPNPPQIPGCSPLPPPGNGTSSCATLVTPYRQYCTFSCNQGFVILGSTSLFCYDDGWRSSVPACVVRQGPVIYGCPSNITQSADLGLSTASVDWTVPDAYDHEDWYVWVTANPPVSPPLVVEIGKLTIVYTATDDHGFSSTCEFTIEVIDTQAPIFVRKCPADFQVNANTTMGIEVTWLAPTANDNSGAPVNIDEYGGTPGGFLPIGPTTITYIARDPSGLTANCSFTITVNNVCESSPCQFGGVCELEQNGNYHCLCDNLCAAIYQPVCGSDRISYSSECELDHAKCLQQKSILVASQGTCGCIKDCSQEISQRVCGSNGKTYENECFLRNENCNRLSAINVIRPTACECEISKDNSREARCGIFLKAMECQMECVNGFNAAIPEFLQVRCVNNSWVRKNTAKKYVPVRNLPKCQEHVPGNCPSNHQRTNQSCIPCAPGSSFDNNSGSCKECSILTYQDVEGQGECKSCNDGSNTATTTGAEYCFFPYLNSLTSLLIDIDIPQQFDEDQFIQDLSTALTTYCQQSADRCNFETSNNRVKKRATSDIKFTKEHIIVLSTQRGTSQVTVNFLVLNPSSTSAVPTNAFSTENLDDLLRAVISSQQSSFEYQVAKVGNKPTTPEKKSSSNAPKIAGAVIGVLAVIFLGFILFMYIRRQNQKRQLEGGVSVQFQNNAQGGNMNIGAPMAGQAYPEPAQGPQDGAQLGFVNQVYSELNPPPYAATVDASARRGTDTPPHVYEMPDSNVAGALPKKEPLYESAVVDVIPQKTDAKVALPPQNTYSLPPGVTLEHQYAVPEGAESDLALDPPPRYDNAKLQVMREKAASSILPNVPRKKDSNDNQEKGGASSRRAGASHELDDATKDQSHT